VSALTPFAEAAILDPLAVQFALGMARLVRLDTCGAAGDDAADLVLLGLAAASAAVNRGHVCCTLSVAGELLPPDIDPRPGVEPPPPPTFPEAARWREALAASSLVVPAEEATRRTAPLVLDGERLYLHRYWDYERRLASALDERARAEAPPVDPERLEAALEQLFPSRPSGPDLQREAARRAVERRLAIITGGPGTGKTSTVVRVLAALLDQAPDLRIQLLAPTGKAAVRMSEAIREAKEDRERLVVSDAVRRRIPEDASTIHRALGFQPGSPTRFFHGQDYPLLADVVVVDEASMVDLSLMTKLVLAVRPDARLVLLGDKDQLASVEAGYVLGELCQSPALAPCRVELLESHRFDGQGGIGALARAINAGEADRSMEILRDPERTEVVLVEPAPGVGALERQLERLVVPPLRERVRASTTPAAALAALGRFQVLAAHRRGRFGAALLNQVIERWLAAAGDITLDGPSYAGRPIVVTVNDRGLQLYNGDTGVILPDAGGMLRSYLPDTRDGGIRSLTPAQLPPHETFYATTVHKGQGSGYDEVVVILPAEPSPVVTRELLYTAVTRARKKVTLVGSEAVVRHAVGARIFRASGLAEVLGRGVGATSAADGTG